ncbi:hypothetical protein LWC08_02900 [Desulfobaculum bizertense]|uniref:hypothetical protein n=1 Tax=Desulfobaculum bizertense TaxID=376490 RepID=UPI001F170BB2|nr:hypothetical protein [Desulfobaculum bizertense]UIJ38533.1 hypothetical protein LWC08_02900 [Desulfobaculum bizertense]
MKSLLAKSYSDTIRTLSPKTRILSATLLIFFFEFRERYSIRKNPSINSIKSFWESLSNNPFSYYLKDADGILSHVTLLNVIEALLILIIAHIIVQKIQIFFFEFLSETDKVRLQKEKIEKESQKEKLSMPITSHQFSNLLREEISKIEDVLISYIYFEEFLSICIGISYCSYQYTNASLDFWILILSCVFLLLIIFHCIRIFYTKIVPRRIKLSVYTNSSFP